jgi:hypothetical protein
VLFVGLSVVNWLSTVQGMNSVKFKNFPLIIVIIFCLFLGA